MLKKFFKVALVISGLAFVMSCDLLPSNNDDVKAPVITLIGNASISINESDVYTEQGATATDDVDGNITSDIVVSGTIDTEIPGIYEITYNVQDTAGNSATTLTRTVTVVNVQEFSKWNSGTSQWEAYDYQPPVGTQEVINNYSGSLLMAWTDALKIYSFSYSSGIWEILPYTLPTNTKQVLAVDTTFFVILKDDGTLWFLDDGTLATVEDQSIPGNTIDIFLTGGEITAFNTNGSVSSYDSVSTHIWYDQSYLFPTSLKENIGPVDSFDNYIIRLLDGGLYDYDPAVETLTSLNITVPLDARKTAYIYGIDDTFVVLH